VSIEPIAFWGLAVVLLASSLAVVLTRNLFHSVLYLALSLTATAGVFLSLDAEFLAAVQLLLYAGGVVTIAVFAIVVTERLVGDRITQTSRQILTGFILSGALLVALLAVFRRGPLTVPRPVVTGDLTQVDLPSGKRSGLTDASEVLRGVEGISFVYFDERDVVRHPLVQRIVKAYERYQEGRQLALKLTDPAGELAAQPPESLPAGAADAREIPLN